MAKIDLDESTRGQIAHPQILHVVLLLFDDVNFQRQNVEYNVFSKFSTDI